MTSPLNQLSALGIRPKKGLGQNFLVDPAHRARIVAAAELTPDDTVLEVGPGAGVLTELITAIGQDVKDAKNYFLTTEARRRGDR